MSTQIVGPVRHGAPQRRITRHHRAAWVVPVVLGVVFGVYALFLGANNGMTTGTAALRGLVAAVVVAAVCFFIGTRQRRMEAETQAIVYAAVFGIAIGYLLSLSGQTVLKASLLGLIIGGCMGVCTFYLSFARRH